MTLRSCPSVASLKLLSALALCAIASSAASPARAQTAASPTPVKPASPTASPSAPVSLGTLLHGDARSEYEAGRSLYGLGDRAGALVKFSRAYELSHEARLLWNMAACERDLHHYAKVIHLLERYRAEGNKSLTANEHADAERIIADARRLVSPLRIEVNEGGALVEIDGEPVGTTPLPEPLLVDLGRRTLRVSKAGFQQQIVNQEVPGATPLTVAVTLVPVAPTVSVVAVPAKVADGRLLVSTEPGAVIRLDGQAVGMGRWEGSVSPGTHQVSVSASGKETRSSDVAVASGESRSVQLTLKSTSSALSTVLWISGGALAIAGLSVGGYYLLRPSAQTEAPIVGSMTPGLIPMPEK